VAHVDVDSALAKVGERRAAVRATGIVTAMPAKRTAAKKTTVRKTTRKRRGSAERGPEASAPRWARRPSIAAVVASIRGAGAARRRLGSYGDTPLVLASLPVGAVEATPFQRDLPHADRLATCDPGHGRLDPDHRDAGAGRLPVTERPSSHRCAQLRPARDHGLVTVDAGIAYRISR
jgi:hypothetical protein